MSDAEGVVGVLFDDAVAVLFEGAVAGAAGGAAGLFSAAGALGAVVFLPGALEAPEAVGAADVVVSPAFFSADFSFLRFFVVSAALPPGAGGALGLFSVPA